MISVICLRICWRRHLRWFSKMCNFSPMLWSASNRNYAVHPRAQEFKWCVRIGWGNCGIRLLEPPCRYVSPTNGCNSCTNVASISLFCSPKKGRKKEVWISCWSCSQALGLLPGRNFFLMHRSVKRCSCAEKDGVLRDAGGCSFRKKRRASSPLKNGGRLSNYLLFRTQSIFRCELLCKVWFWIPSCLMWWSDQDHWNIVLSKFGVSVNLASLKILSKQSLKMKSSSLRSMNMRQPGQLEVVFFGFFPGIIWTSEGLRIIPSNPTWTNLKILKIYTCYWFIR